MQARLRHIAIAVTDPEQSARFFEAVFGFERAGTLVGHPLGDGVFLSDGTINLAFIKFATDQTGHGLDYVGAHHFGILVDDRDDVAAACLAAGAIPIEENLDDGHQDEFEMKFRGPDGIVFDIAQTGWTGSADLTAG